MSILKSFVGKTTATICVVLVACFAALFIAATVVLERNELARFDTPVQTITSFLSEQVNTGTRLKRAAMIAPQVDGALTSAGMDIVGLRITHTDGTEVVAKTAEGVPVDIIANLPALGFSQGVTSSREGSFVMARSSVELSAGADRKTVGELVAVWDATPKLAALYSKEIVAGIAVLLTLVLVLASCVLRFASSSLARLARP
ncbi:MAG: hypothetical protein AAF762_02635 [Pseudomonadota bacterium]